MASVTVRNIDESVKGGLRLRAARHGHSVEQEIRTILQQAVAPEMAAQLSFAERIQARLSGNTIDQLPVPKRRATRPPPSLA